MGSDVGAAAYAWMRCAWVAALTLAPLKPPMAPGGPPRLCLFGGLYYCLLQAHHFWVKHGQGGTSTARCWNKDISLWLGCFPKEKDFGVEAVAQTLAQPLKALAILNCLNS